MMAECIKGSSKMGRFVGKECSKWLMEKLLKLIEMFKTVSCEIDVNDDTILFYFDISNNTFILMYYLILIKM